jgi:signal peptidase I
MEPALRSGDVVLVRKCDAGALSGIVWSLLVGDEAVRDDDGNNNTDKSGRGGGNRTISTNNNASGGCPSRAVDRARVLRIERGSGAAGRSPGRLYDAPPVALPGDVVVFKDPAHYVPKKLAVKRVVAAGGQNVRVTAARDDGKASRKEEVRWVPPYYLHVEGESGVGKGGVSAWRTCFAVPSFPDCHARATPSTTAAGSLAPSGSGSKTSRPVGWTAWRAGVAASDAEHNPLLRCCRNPPRAGGGGGPSAGALITTRARVLPGPNPQPHL